MYVKFHSCFLTAQIKNYTGMIDKAYPRCKYSLFFFPIKYFLRDNYFKMKIPQYIHV